jgi:S-adenosyl methyltransferase
MEPHEEHEVKATTVAINIRTPNAARIYDYLLEGKDNYAADREAAEKFLAVAPEIRFAARENRAFLIRAVRFLAAEAGVRQFLDLGSGLPTQSNVHTVAHEVAPGPRVVYVDHDPVVIAHSRTILSDISNATAIQADVRRPDDILNHPKLRKLIYFDQPVALLCVGLLFLVADDDDPAGIVTQFRETMVPGSYLALSHITSDGQRPEAVERLVQAFEQAREPMVPRTREQIQQFFDGFEFVDPGLVRISEWRPDDPSTAQNPGKGWLYAGVGRKN